MEGSKGSGGSQKSKKPDLVERPVRANPEGKERSRRGHESRRAEGQGEQMVARKCEQCDTWISEARLQARPSTRLCIVCKSMSDEPRITGESRCVRGVLVRNSLSDADELFRETTGAESD